MEGVGFLKAPNEACKDLVRLESSVYTVIKYLYPRIYGDGEVAKLEANLGLLGCAFDLLSISAELNVNCIIGLLTIVVNLTGCLNGFYKDDPACKRHLGILNMLFSHENTSIGIEVPRFLLILSPVDSFGYWELHFGGLRPCYRTHSAWVYDQTYQLSVIVHEKSRLRVPLRRNGMGFVPYDGKAF